MSLYGQQDSSLQDVSWPPVPRCEKEPEVHLDKKQEGILSLLPRQRVTPTPKPHQRWMQHLQSLQAGLYQGTRASCKPRGRLGQPLSTSSSKELPALFA